MALSATSQSLQGAGIKDSGPLLCHIYIPSPLCFHSYVSSSEALVRGLLQLPLPRPLYAGSGVNLEDIVPHSHSVPSIFPLLEFPQALPLPQSM